MAFTCASWRTMRPGLGQCLSRPPWKMRISTACPVRKGEHNEEPADALPFGTRGFSSTHTQLRIPHYARSNSLRALLLYPAEPFIIFHDANRRTPRPL